MKGFAIFFPLFVLAHPAPAADAADDRLAAVKELGRINGEALACERKDTAAWVRVLMLTYAPKTRAHGEAYEAGTQERFVAQGRGVPCSPPAELAARIEEVTLRLKGSAPAAVVLPPGHTPPEELPGGNAPRYLLQDPNGRAVGSDEFRGRFQLIAFGYTSCPDVCPTTLLEMKEVLRLLGERAGRLQAIFVTVDPERDSAQVLREYTAAFDPRILGLRGSAALTQRAAAEFRVRYEKVRDPAAPPASYTVDHSAGTILLGPDGQALARFAYATPAQRVAARIEALMSEEGTRPAR